MEKKMIIEKLMPIIKAVIRNNEEFENVTADTDLVNEKGMNSLEALEILVRVENEFNIQIDDEDLTVELVRTISSLAQYIETKI